MKKLLLFISLSLVSSPAFAASSTSTIGIVNLRRCLEESALGKKEAAEFEKMKNIKLLDKTVSIKTRLTDDSRAQLGELADEIMKEF